MQNMFHRLSWPPDPPIPLLTSTERPRHSFNHARTSQTTAANAAILMAPVQSARESCVGLSSVYRKSIAGDVVRSDVLKGSPLSYSLPLAANSKTTAAREPEDIVNCRATDAFSCCSSLARRDLDGRRTNVIRSRAVPASVDRGWGQYTALRTEASWRHRRWRVSLAVDPRISLLHRHHHCHIRTANPQCNTDWQSDWCVSHIPQCMLVRRWRWSTVY